MDFSDRNHIILTIKRTYPEVIEFHTQQPLLHDNLSE